MKSIVYRLWKHLNKKNYGSSFSYRLHKHLSKILLKKGLITSYTPLKLKKWKPLYEITGRIEKIEKKCGKIRQAGSFKLYKEDAFICYKKFFSLQLYANTLETLIVGSSHGHYGYYAEERFHEINACEASQDLYYSYEIYKKYSNSPRLKNIVLFYSVFSPGFLLELTSMEWRCDFYRFFYDIPYRFSKDYEKKDIMLSIAEYILKEKASVAHDFHYTGNCSYKYFEKTDKNILNDRIKGHLNGNRRDQNQTAYVEKASKLASEKGHKLYVIIPPARSDYTNLLPSSAELFPDLLKLKDIRILSFLGDQRFLDSDFGDSDHLNKQGAEKLTELIRRSFNS